MTSTETAAPRQVLTGGVVLTMNARREVFSPGVLVIEGERIAHVGPDRRGRAGGVDLRRRRADDVIVDCRDHLLMPGLVNTHTHTCAVLFRGLAEDRSREAWVGYGLPYLERATPEDYYWGTLLGGLEMLTRGVTCTADRFSFMGVCAEAFDRVGLRAVVGHSLFDLGRRLEWDQALALIERWGTSPERRVCAGLAPHAPDTCSDDLLRRVRALADTTGARVFIHCAQSEAELAALRARGYPGAVHCLRAGKLLGPDVVAAHCLYVDADEIRLLAETGTSVAHCPASNAKTEGRMPPMCAMLAAGVRVGLGTDWAPTNNGMDLFDEMKTAGLLNKVAADDPAAMPVEVLLAMATIDGARVLGLDAIVGSLEAGKRADVIALGTDGLHLQPWPELAGNLVYAAKGQDVRHVWVDGRWLVRDGRPAEIDAADVRERVGRIRRRWQTGTP